MNLRIWSLYVSGAKGSNDDLGGGEGTGSESNDDADNDDQSPKGYGQAGVFCQKPWRL